MISNSISPSEESNKTPMTEKESPKQENQAKTTATELTKDQMAKSNLIQISSKTEKEWMNFLKATMV